MSDGDIFGLIGTGGFAREVMPYLKAARQRGDLDAALAFVDVQRPVERQNDVPVMLEDEFIASSYHSKYFNIAVDNWQKRRAISETLIARGCIPKSIFAGNSSVLDGVEIGEGAIFCAYAMATSNARIGRFFHANIYAYVAHDCVVGDFTSSGRTTPI
jgi:hypothetical protein